MLADVNMGFFLFLFFLFFVCLFVCLFVCYAAIAVLNVSGNTTILIFFVASLVLYKPHFISTLGSAS